MRKTLVALVTSAVLGTSLITAVPANAHVSTCTITRVTAPANMARGYTGGYGQFECDPFNNHHEYISVRVDTQYLSMNLPGTRLDQFSTIIDPTRMSPMRAETEATKGTFPTAAPCRSGRQTYRINFTLAMVGAHGVRSKSKAGPIVTMDCRRT